VLHHQLTYPRVQENRKSQHIFTGCTEISYSAQAQKRSSQGENTASLLLLSKVELTRPQAWLDLKMANDRAGKKTDFLRHVSHQGD